MYGEQEHSTYNGHFESTCYHPLLLFNREGDCLAAKLRSGNVHSAEGWEQVLLPEVERQRRLALPRRVGSWSLTSLQQRLMKTGGRLVKHARYYWLRGLLFKSSPDPILIASKVRKR